MNSRQRILKLAIMTALAVTFLISGFFFIRWLYFDSSDDAALTAFADYSQNKIKALEYPNLYISIINSVIPSAGVSYESRYGQKLPGFAASSFSNMFNGMNFDIKNPRTYFSFAFTAFSQYDPKSLASMVQKDDNTPGITSFDEAPEGEIYFSEEEEYRAEEAASSDEQQTGDEPSDSLIVVKDPARLEIEKKQPSVLILHTHSMESYSPYNNNNYHSLNEKENVIQVGSIITDLLESKYKYNVVHDKTKFDRYSYADSYINSQKGIISQLEKNPSVKVIIDVHRDAVDAKTERAVANNKAEYTTEINGKKAAKISFVIGPDNKNFEELKSFAVYVQKKMDKLYPGLFYKTVIKPKGKYNQFYRDHTLLIEVGSISNTVQEARYSGELLGNVLGEVLKDLEQ